MAWLAVDKDGTEIISPSVPYREYSFWSCVEDYERLDIELPKGSIKKLVGRDLTWADEPVELKEE